MSQVDLSFVAMASDSTARFKKIVRDYYTHHKRNLPWRPPLLKPKNNDVLDAYRVFVSEIMLQQTQVDRVIPKYQAFIRQFPSFTSLANASLTDVLRAWQGLGYNRRALNLKRTAEIICTRYKSKLPTTEKELLALPGIGAYTAGALLAFVYNKPTVFIETNIRSVYIHHFFKNKKNISDTQLLRYIAVTLNKRNPRAWYYALMDYGSFLKTKYPNPNSKSKHYTKQSPFKGSRRELRGTLLRLITRKPRTLAYLAKETHKSKKEIANSITQLQKDGLVEVTKGVVKIAK